MYKHKPHYLLFILLFLMAVMVYFCEPLMACEQGRSQNDSAGVADSSQSSKSEPESQQATSSVAQTDISHDGNGGESVPLIDCRNPVFYGLVPCRITSTGN